MNDVLFSLHSSVLRIGDQVSRRVDEDAGIWHNETLSTDI